MVNFKSNLQTFNGVSILDFTFVEVGVAASLIYDTRDNTLMPASGYVSDHLVGYDQTLGGDFDYSSARLKGLSYHTFGQQYVLDLRLDISQADGDGPFYAILFVRLRYLAVKKQDAWVGIDIASGPEEVAIYIQMGIAW